MLLFTLGVSDLLLGPCTGLGLAVAEKIIDEHDGVIAVRSKQGDGSSFTLRLPVRQETLADPSQTHGPAR